MSRPRAATSLATKILILPSLNSFNVDVRTDWGRSPWSALALILFFLNNWSTDYTSLFRLQNTIAFFALFLGKTNNFEIDLGYGINKLTREFYGYQDYHITSTNISNQEGVQSIKSDGTIKMFQIFYKFDRKPSWLPDKFFSKLSIDFGARYTESNHRISSSDPRPAYDSNGLPSETKFEVGGVGLLGTLTYHY